MLNIFEPFGGFSILAGVSVLGSQFCFLNWSAVILCSQSKSSHLLQSGQEAQAALYFITDTTVILLHLDHIGTVQGWVLNVFTSCLVIFTRFRLSFR